MEKTRVLVVGGTGYIGKRIVRACLDQGHMTYVLQRPAQEIGLDIEKLQMLLAFKEQGAQLVEGSFSDHQSLVNMVKQVDVVICTTSGVHHRSHNILMQLKLVEAIKEAGNVKMGTLLPPKDKVGIYGGGNEKVIFVDEDDVATYTVKTIADRRTLNKTLYLRPQENILTQRELVDKWEKLLGRTLEKFHISAQDFLATMKVSDYATRAGLGHFYHIFYEGCLANFEIGEEGEEASQLYPEVQYTRMDSYLKRYI
ncbi:isoflavone reductase homolog isoform X3 [Actinidia eriantha]|uniref:isoflavone reductase homolog isoform X3 n=1 Tax=Actinidia eriantha TaxID=165200 RepID=UPI00258A4BDD|nr:isoflavone reductase homolog isoform X3 [Actinidia eriantha]